MKTNKFAAIALAVFSVMACNSPKTTTLADGTNAESLKPSKSLVDSASYLLGVNFGQMVKGYNLGELNYSEVKKGVDDFIKSNGTPRDTNFASQFKIDPAAINEVMGKFIEQRGAYTAAINKAEGEKFLAENKSKEGVVETESGLQYIILEPGNDVKPGDKDTLFVHYRGTLLDGNIFDECPESEPSARLRISQVIPGWSEGLKLIGEGGKARLFIPSDLAYGDRGAGDMIKPGTTLIFDVKLDSIKRFVETEVPQAKPGIKPIKK